MDDAEYEEGGEPVCLAHLVCPECGAVTSEGHRVGCQSAVQAPALPMPERTPADPNPDPDQQA